MTKFRRLISIRTALAGAMLLTVAVASSVVGVLGVVGVTRYLGREAQQQVDHDLNAVRTQYRKGLERMAAQLEGAASGLHLDDPNLAIRLEELRHGLDLNVLNVCDADGTPIAGTYPSADARVPLNTDPVLYRALRGNAAHGTVPLAEDRLRLEGGPALINALTIPPDHDDSAPGTTSALFWWAARPLRDTSGRVVGLVYGGHALNRDFAFVDELRELVFGTREHEGKPLGTVTLFLHDIRVATNVLMDGRRRAVGTQVSDKVRRAVLEEGQVWSDRAWVVDRWYISAYEPLVNPDGEPVGILYVGVLEAPYEELRLSMLARLFILIFLSGAVALVVALLLVRHITAPLSRLEKAAAEMAKGGTGANAEVTRGYEEIVGLAQSFSEMQQAIAERDRSLNEQNEKLARANRNYMETLGFVTHELKSPLAAMQSLIDLLVQGHMGEVPEAINDILVRIKRNCEELQDMVKNYLDLSRAERGELTAVREPVDLREMVIDPCVEQAQSLFDSRAIQFEADCPDELPCDADQELLRIALTNYLSNAAKYGREGGGARLTARLENGEVILCVRNEGQGFTAEEKDKLFGKFQRLKNENTRGKRGSGLGLFLCRQIAELHGGRVWAESEPGQWAEFCLAFPARQKEDESSVNET